MCQAPTCGRKVHAIYLLERRLLCPGGIGPAAPIQSGQLEKGTAGEGVLTAFGKAFAANGHKVPSKGAKPGKAIVAGHHPRRSVDFPPPPSLPLSGTAVFYHSPVVNPSLRLCAGIGFIRTRSLVITVWRNIGRPAPIEKIVRACYALRISLTHPAINHPKKMITAPQNRFPQPISSNPREGLRREMPRRTKIGHLVRLARSQTKAHAWSPPKPYTRCCLS